jgi:hypothetical protein
MLSWFVAPLRCPVCGTVTDDAITDMGIRLPPWPPADVLRVGDETGYDWTGLARYYLPLREPGEREPIRLLQSWVCPVEGALNWAEIVIDAGRIASIKETTLTLETLDRAHAIDERVNDAYWQLTGEPLISGPGVVPDWDERLRAALAPG